MKESPELLCFLLPRQCVLVRLDTVGASGGAGGARRPLPGHSAGGHGVYALLARWVLQGLEHEVDSR